MKQSVMISRRLFGLLCEYHLMDERDPALVHEIQQEVQWKLDAIVAHDRYIPRRDGGVDKGEQGGD